MGDGPFIFCFVAIWLGQIIGTVVPPAFSLSTIRVMPRSATLSRDLEEIYSNLHIHIHIQSQRGVLVPTSESVYYYLRLWSLRSVATVLQPVLTRLTYHRNARRKFGHFLRQEWMLDYGSFKTAAEISEQETHARVLRVGTCGLACLHCTT